MAFSKSNLLDRKKQTPAKNLRGKQIHFGISLALEDGYQGSVPELSLTVQVMNMPSRHAKGNSENNR